MLLLRFFSCGFCSGNKNKFFFVSDQMYEGCQDPNGKLESLVVEIG